MCRTRLLSTAAVFLLLLGTLPLRAQAPPSIRFQEKLSANDLVLEERFLPDQTKVTRVRLRGATETSQPGFPILPCIVRHVALPKGAKILSLSVDPGQVATVQGHPVVDWQRGDQPGGQGQREPKPIEYPETPDGPLFYAPEATPVPLDKRIRPEAPPWRRQLGRRPGGELGGHFTARRGPVLQRRRVNVERPAFQGSAGAGAGLRPRRLQRPGGLLVRPLQQGRGPGKPRILLLHERQLRDGVGGQRQLPGSHHLRAAHPDEVRQDDLFELSEAAMQSELNSGYNIVSLSGHGWPGGCCAVDRGYVDDLTNGFKGGIVYAESCSTNRFPDSDAVSEVFLKTATGGAAAYVGNSRYSWVGLGDDIERLFWDRLRTDRHVGRLHNSKAALADNNNHRWAQFALNLEGDPEMPAARRPWSWRTRRVWPRESPSR